MKAILSSILILAVVQASALNAAHFTINRITAPYFIVDGNSPTTITKAYVGFEVINNSNSGVTYNNLKFTITSIGTSVAGQTYSVIAPATGVINLGTLAPGASGVCYFYIAYPANTSPKATFNITLSDNTASSKTASFVVSNRSSISANAGGSATQTFSNQDLIGGIVTDDVTYAVGNVQNGDETDFQVAVSTQFDPTKISLLSTKVISTSVPGIAANTTDSLYFITGNGSNGATVTIRWTFRITAYNFTTYLLPCAGATSGGSNYKYALNTSLGSGSPVTISSSANPLLITKTSNQSLFLVNSTNSLFTVTISNPGAYGVTIDKIIDQLPAGFTFQAIDNSSQVTSSNSTSTPSAGSSGTITFEGGVVSGGNTSYYIPAGGTYILKYTAVAPASSASNLLTTVQDFVGTTMVGSAQNTVSVSTILPVKLISFGASAKKETIQLDWETSSETNTSLFEVERSGGDGQFKKIGEQTASGNTDKPVSYLFVDKGPSPGKNYYRLRMIDRDGKWEYSNIISIISEKVVPLYSIYPNPVSDAVSVTIDMQNAGKLSLRLYDMNGHLLLSTFRMVEKGISTQVIDGLNKFKAGNYILKLSVPGLEAQQILTKPL
jgi:hypothetical protein